MGEVRIKYLEMIQEMIARMAGNQVNLRTWSVALGTAVIGYAAVKEGQPSAALLAILPTATFWILDGYYLALERKFRAIFNVARQVPDDKVDFSMDVSEVTVDDLWETCGRPAVWMVHVPVMVLALAVGAWGWLK